MSNDRSSQNGARAGSQDEDVRSERALARWSRRKSAARRGRPEDAPQARTDHEHRKSVAPDRQSARAEQGSPDLPNPELLDITSDFTVFLRKGVDPVLQRAALRKLWSLDAVFNHQDGLVEYGEDFTDAAKATSVVRTAVREALPRVQAALDEHIGSTPAAAQSGETETPGAEAAGAGAGGETGRDAAPDDQSSTGPHPSKSAR